jgi:hypothetical protein
LRAGASDVPRRRPEKIAETDPLEERSGPPWRPVELLSNSAEPLPNDPPPLEQRGPLGNEPELLREEIELRSREAEPLFEEFCCREREDLSSRNRVVSGRLARADSGDLISRHHEFGVSVP